MWCTAWPKKGNLGGADKNSWDTMLRRSQCQVTIAKARRGIRRKASAAKIRASTSWPHGHKTAEGIRGHFAEDDTLHQNPHVKTTCGAPEKAKADPSPAPQRARLSRNARAAARARGASRWGPRMSLRSP